MREKTERILSAILVMMVLPCAITLLLGGRMEDIYRAIRRETEYISVKTGSGLLEMELEDYVIGVTAAQIPLDYGIEAIKAQMVLARTNLYRQMQEEKPIPETQYLTMEELERAGAAEKFLRAQRATSGEILTWQEEPIMASFHAVSAGKTREGNEVLQSEDYPYLAARDCPADERAPDYFTELEIDKTWAQMEISERDGSGYVQQIQMGEELLSGEEFRNLLGLPSAHLEVKKEGGRVFLEVRGAGHGLGMSQYTARQLAEAGKTYREILGYFYEGVKLEAL